MPRDYLNNVIGKGYGHAEHGEPGHDYGESSMNGPDEATLKHEAFLRWLETEHPDAHMRVRAGDYISDRLWQHWIKLWRLAP